MLTRLEVSVMGRVFLTARSALATAISELTRADDDSYGALGQSLSAGRAHVKS